MATANVFRRTCSILLLVGITIISTALLFRVQIAEAALSEILGRTANISGDVHIDWGMSPSIHVTALSVANPAWARHDMLFRARSATLAIDLGAWLHKKRMLVSLNLLQPALYLERSLRDGGNWHTAGRKSNAPSRLPFDFDIVVRNGTVSYVNHVDSAPTRLQVDHLEAHVEHTLSLKAHGAGSFRGRPYRFSAYGGESKESTGLDGPYPFAVDIFYGGARLSAHGRIIEPLDLSRIDAQFAVQGDNAADFASLTEFGSLDLPFRVSGHLSGTASEWAVSAIKGAIGNSVFRGNVARALSRTNPILTGNLAFEKLDAHLIAAFYKREATESASSNGISYRSLLQQLATYDANVQVRVDQIAGASLPVGPLTLEIHSGSRRIVIDLEYVAIGNGKVQGNLVLKPIGQFPIGEITMDADELNLTPVSEILGGMPLIIPLARATLDGKLHVGVSANGVDAASGRLQLADPDDRTHLDVEFGRRMTSGQWALHATARGKFRGEPLSATFTGKPFNLLKSKEIAWPVALQASVGPTRVEIEGTIRGIGKAFDTQVHVSGPDTRRLSYLTGLPFPYLPAFDVSAHVIWQPPLVRFENATAQVGNSHLTGSGAFNRQQKGNSINAIIHAKILDFRDFDQMHTTDDGGRDWIHALDRLNAHIKVEATHVIAMDDVVYEDLLLHVLLGNGQLELAPIRFKVADGSVDAHVLLKMNNAEVEGGLLKADIRNLNLGYALKPFSLDDEMPGQLTADIDLRLGMPPGDLATKSTLNYHDPSHGNDLTFVLRQSDEGLYVEGRGSLWNEAFQLHGQAGSLKQALRRQTYSFGLRLHLLQTDVDFKGSLSSLWKLSGLQSTLVIAGPDLRKFAPAVGLRSPELPPYRLKGNLTHQGLTWRFSEIQGRIGDSDLGGELTVVRGKGKPLVQGSLYSRHLDFDDLAGVVGATPDTKPDETSSADQKIRSAKSKHERTVLPNRELDFAVLSDLDADLHYEAITVDADRLPMARLGVDISLSQGRLLIAPVVHGNGGGTIDGHVVLQAHPRSASAQASVELMVKNMALEELLKYYRIRDGSRGTISGSLSLNTEGRSMAQMLGRVDGKGTLSMSGGALDALLVELGGLDGGESLLLWLGEDRLVGVRCAQVTAIANKGMVRLTTGVLDTSDTKFTMTGTIGFAEETLNILLKAYPKDFSLFVARTPFEIEGTFKNPQFHPVWSGLFLRGAAALLLGAITPPAALLAFIEPGLGDNAECGRTAIAGSDD